MKVLYGNDLVKELRRNSDNIKKRLWIAVPFIGGLKSVLRIIGRKWIDDPKISVRLLTDVKEISNFNSDTIKLFFKKGKIKHLRGLHSKIYITDNTTLLTSANLTNTAFKKRYEIGNVLEFTNSDKAINIFNKWWKIASNVSSKQINKVVIRKGNSKEDSSGFGLDDLWDLPVEPKVKIPSINSTGKKRNKTKSDKITYWIKPYGTANEPLDEDRLFNITNDVLRFSKSKNAPKINIGDVLIGYGIGIKKFVSFYRSTSIPEYISKKDLAKNKKLQRWPWFIKAKNLTTKYGNIWYEYNLKADILINEFLKNNPGKHITLSGGDNLNALNYGHSYVRLEDDFAKFVIKKITKINDIL